MKIATLKINGVFGLNGIEIDSLPNVVVITGANGAGKTRLLNSIMAALKYENVDAQTRKRLLETDGEIELVTSDGLKIKRFFKNGKSRLSVTDENGMHGNQQTLNKLIAGNFVDLNKFLSLPREKRDDAILGLVGIKDDLEKLRARYNELYDQRRALGVKKKDFHPGEKIVIDENLPILAEVEKKIEEVNKSNLAIERLKVEKEKALSSRFHFKNKHDENVSKIEELRKEILKLESENITFVNDITGIELQIKSYNSELERMVEIPVSDLQQERKKAVERERLELALETWNASNDKYEKLGTEYNQMSSDLEKIIQEKDELIGNCEFPISGMSYSKDGITMNGHLLSSDGQFRLLAFKIAKLISGKLKMATFNNFSLLDANAKKAVIKDAEEAGFQVFLEVVSVEKQDDSTLHIVEGEQI